MNDLIANKSQNDSKIKCFVQKTSDSKAQIFKKGRFFRLGFLKKDGRLCNCFEIRGSTTF